MSTPVDRRVVCQTYHPRCRVQIGEYILFTDLIVLPMHDFDVILGMDWLARYLAVWIASRRQIDSPLIV